MGKRSACYHSLRKVPAPRRAHIKKRGSRTIHGKFIGFSTDFDIPMKIGKTSPQLLAQKEYDELAEALLTSVK
jgi:hypothetical protein